MEMSRGLAGIAAGVAAQANANTGLQITLGVSLINLIFSYFPLMQAYSQTLNDEMTQYFYDSTDVNQSSPWYAGLAAADYGKYNLTNSEMDRDTGALSNLIDANKSEISAVGNDMGNVYQAESPVIQLEKQVVNLLLQF